MTVFADASAVVKLFVIEASSPEVRGAAGPYVVSALTEVEVASALWRKHREGELTANEARLLVDGLRWDIADGQFSSGASVAEVSIGPGVLDAAVRQRAEECDARLLVHRDNGGGLRGLSEQPVREG